GAPDSASTPTGPGHTTWSPRSVGSTPYECRPDTDSAVHRQPQTRPPPANTPPSPNLGDTRPKPPLSAPPPTNTDPPTQATATQVLRTGSDVILDWNQWSRQRRAEWRDRAQASGWAVVLYHLDVSVERAVRRAQERESALGHDLDEGGVRHLAALFEPPET